MHLLYSNLKRRRYQEPKYNQSENKNGESKLDKSAKKAKASNMLSATSLMHSYNSSSVLPPCLLDIVL